MKLKKKEKKLIHDLARTKTIRELSRVLLSYMTVEQMSEFVATYLVFKSKDVEEKALNYYIRNQLFPLLKTVGLAIGDLLPDFITDTEFMKLYTKLPKKLEFKKDKNSKS